MKSIRNLYKNRSRISTSIGQDVPQLYEEHAKLLSWLESLKSKREKTLAEIFSSEVKYVDSMNKLVLVCKRNAKCFTDEQVKTIFSNVEVLLNFNQSLLKELASQVLAWKSQARDPSFGKLFSEMSHMFKMYAPYCDNHETAVRTLQACAQDNPEVQSYLEMCQHTCDNQSVQSFLIMPVQRIPRYKMLLMELRKRTDKGHRDYTDLCKAIEQICEVASRVDVSIKKAEMYRKLAEVHKKYAGLEIAPHRTLIDEADAKIQLLDGDKVQSSHGYTALILFNDIVALIRDKDVKENLPLHLTWVAPVERSPATFSAGIAVDRSFRLLCPEQDYVITLESKEHKRKWMSNVATTISPNISESNLSALVTDRGSGSSRILKVGKKGRRSRTPSTDHRRPHSVDPHDLRAVTARPSHSWKKDLSHSPSTLSRSDHSPPSSPSSSPRSNTELTDTTEGAESDTDISITDVSEGTPEVEKEPKSSRGHKRVSKKRLFHGSASPGVPRLHIDDDDDTSMDPVFQDVREDHYVYRDGRSYEGYWRAGRPSGMGTMKWTKKPGLGDIFVGEFSSGLMEGKGRMEYADGAVLEGSWMAALPHGHATLRYTDGVEYCGTWMHGKRNGSGTMSFADGSQYVGEWKDGTMNGKGKYTSETGASYEGEWANGLREGEGKSTQADGETYEGHWSKGMRNGEGKCVFQNGEVYEGAWKDNKRHGKGKHKFINGNVYEGDWVEGKMKGRGHMNFVDGSTYNGQWSNNVQEGLGTWTSEDKKFKYDGNWHLGVRYGQGSYVWGDDGGKYQGGWVENKREGRGTMKYGNGYTYTGNWLADMRHGEGTYESKDGKVKYSGNWDNDARHGSGCYTDGYVTFDGIWDHDSAKGNGQLTFATSDLCITGTWNHQLVLRNHDGASPGKTINHYQSLIMPPEQPFLDDTRRS